MAAPAPGNALGPPEDYGDILDDITDDLASQRATMQGQVWVDRPGPPPSWTKQCVAMPVM